MKIAIQAHTGSTLITRRGRWLPVNRRWPRRSLGLTITGAGIPANTTIVGVSGATARISNAFTMLPPDFLTSIAGLATSCGMSEGEATSIVMRTAGAYTTTETAELHR